MSEFKFVNKVNPNKVFIIGKNKIEKRIDPFYYIPSILELENNVKKQLPKPLRKYVASIASGATPKTSEAEKYYTDKENGIPFLRVQNLSPTGILDIENVKYITKETHNTMLKRSQVSEGDLLVKITGVGRMAVASVAPDGFIGNTNQHMVVIKTGSKEISEILAAYLNTDISEALASRRATGGTRPALDYPALLSIPIIKSDKILEIRKQAIEIKQQKEKQAKDLLNSIDTYLLNELGINKRVINADKYGMFSLSKTEKNYQIFQTSLTDLIKRYDPTYHIPIYNQLEQDIVNSKYNIISIKSICQEIKSGKAPSKYYDEGYHYIKVRNVQDLKYNWKTDKISISDSSRDYLLRSGDITMVTMGAGSLGKVSLFEETFKCQFDPKITMFRVNELVNNYYLLYFFRSLIFQKLLEREIRGSTGMTMLNPRDIASINIPLPPIEKQNEIAIHISGIRAQAKQLQQDVNEALETAKNEVQKLILGE